MSPANPSERALLAAMRTIQAATSPGASWDDPRIHQVAKAALQRWHAATLKQRAKARAMRAKTREQP